MDVIIYVATVSANFFTFLMFFSFLGAGFACLSAGIGDLLEEDKRATTNAQNGLVFFFWFLKKKEP